ncbi:MAG TPA: type II toxin-antitoxin system VapC family toxin [Gemmataceae bacterium]|nr:type II toxin-antitoxin system VapC family toxin [Gemmataceae bacterium]
MKPRVYLETTIPSYLTAWPSRDLVRAAHQQLTSEWWQRKRAEFELFASQVVVRECQAGDPVVAAERLQILRDLTLLDQTEQATDLAQALLEQTPLPERAAVDALHIAIATVHGMDFVLTWNCAHIANAVLRNQIESVCREAGYEPPTICTPEELLLDEGEENG